MKYEISLVNSLFIVNENSKYIFSYDSGGYWYKRDYDEKGERIYYENSNGQKSLYGRIII